MRSRCLESTFKDVSRVQEYRYAYPKKGVIGLTHRPVVVGFGPAGMFAALLLAQMGYCPLVIERGQCVEDRVRSVEDFWQTVSWTHRAMCSLVREEPVRFPMES